MATNFYFNNFSNSQEQILIEDLIWESIRIYGQDCFYLPRIINSKDEIYGQDSTSYFSRYYTIELYIKNIDKFDGDGDLFNKFALDIADRVTFTISRRTFDQEVAAGEAIDRPREGDLIYLPLNRKIFQIKFVEHEAIFYQMGSLQTFDLECELFDYSGEMLNTGIPDVDSIQLSYNVSLTNDAYITEEFNYYSILDEDGFKLVNESYNLENIDTSSDNYELELEADGFIDFSEIDPFSEGNI